MKTATLDAKVVGAVSDWFVSGAGGDLALSVRDLILGSPDDSTYIYGTSVGEKQEFTLGSSNGEATPGPIPSQKGASTTVHLVLRFKTTSGLTGCTITYNLFSGSTDLGDPQTHVLTSPFVSVTEKTINFSDIPKAKMSDLRIRFEVTAISGTKPQYSLTDLYLQYDYEPSAVLFLSQIQKMLLTED